MHFQDYRVLSRLSSRAQRCRLRGERQREVESPP